MDNFIKINGIEIPLTQAQVEGILGTISLQKEPQKKKFTRVSLADIPVGKVFVLGKYEFVVLEHFKNGTTAIITKDLLFEDEKFGKCNNYWNSHPDKLCCNFATDIAQIVGEYMLVHTVDLTSNDGLKDYGKIERCASLLTTEQYRSYVDILDQYKVDKPWWLATAFSTPKHDNENFTMCVMPDGYLDNAYSDTRNGIRPFCLLKANMEVTSVE